MANARLALTESQFVKQASDMVTIVMHAELVLDDGGHASRGPVIIGEAESHGPLAIDLRHAIQLLPGKTAGPAGSLAALE